MTVYRFDVVCPSCGKESETFGVQHIPAPRVNCGDCLIARVEVVEMKVVKVGIVVTDNEHRKILADAAQMRRLMFSADRDED